MHLYTYSLTHTHTPQKTHLFFSLSIFILPGWFLSDFAHERLPVSLFSYLDVPAFLAVCLKAFHHSCHQTSQQYCLFAYVSSESLPVSLHAYLSVCLHICLPAWLLASQPGRSPICLLANLPGCQSTRQPPSRLFACLVACQSLIHSFIPNISIATLQVHYWEALPTTALILSRC